MIYLILVELGTGLTRLEFGYCCAPWELTAAAAGVITETNKNRGKGVGAFGGICHYALFYFLIGSTPSQIDCTAQLT